jgi:hypothetical protein
MRAPVRAHLCRTRAPLPLLRLLHAADRGAIDAALLHRPIEHALDRRDASPFLSGRPIVVGIDPCLNVERFQLVDSDVGGSVLAKDVVLSTYQS